MDALRYFRGICPTHSNWLPRLRNLQKSESHEYETDRNACHPMRLYLTTEILVGSTFSKHRDREQINTATAFCAKVRDSHCLQIRSSTFLPIIRCSDLWNIMNAIFGSFMHLQTAMQSTFTLSRQTHTLRPIRMHCRPPTADDGADPHASGLAPDAEALGTRQSHHSNHTHPIPPIVYNHIKCKLTSFVASTLAPASTSTRHAASWPFEAAEWRIVDWNCGGWARGD